MNNKERASKAVKRATDLDQIRNMIEDGLQKEMESDPKLIARLRAKHQAPILLAIGREISDRVRVCLDAKKA